MAGQAWDISVIGYLDDLPLWAVFVASTLIVLACTELGYLVARRANGVKSAKAKIVTGPVVSSSIGLLALILAFAFGSATSRYDERKALVLDEANAIGTAYLRADLLPPSERDAFQRLLHEYVRVRLEVVKNPTPESIERAISLSEQMHVELWSSAVAVARAQPTPATSLLLQALNDVIDLHQKRVTVALHHRIPPVLWFALYGLVALTMFIGGYDAGTDGGRRPGPARLAVAFSLALVLFLIAALDRPLEHMSIVSQSAMVDLEREIRESRGPERPSPSTP